MSRIMLDSVKAALAKWKSTLLWTGLPFAIVPLIAGILGVFVLLDVEQTGFLAQTQFGQLYTAMAHWNPFSSAFVFNIGLISTVMIATELQRTAAAAKGSKEKSKPKLEAKQPAEGEKKEDGDTKEGKRLAKKDS
ncbi:hypothetical protein DUNSADRAFT_4353 [Dunaliella salina]|uniref:Uncharacterized protein n=1 Tax=Dunaliella salina TaxID=3046 RepID=A0ABQ7H7R2_DUNSA|nr:hypothetical protein DUNSADRAFT_4353 [Dunaliella salina]|eukprot:KAF5842894.1 hypothetical protein DUNSADRAFT_4353 [Dunaliella salina]